MLWVPKWVRWILCFEKGKSSGVILMPEKYINIDFTKHFSTFHVRINKTITWEEGPSPQFSREHNRDSTHQGTQGNQRRFVTLRIPAHQEQWALRRVQGPWDMALCKREWHPPLSCLDLFRGTGENSLTILQTSDRVLVLLIQGRGRSQPNTAHTLSISSDIASPGKQVLSPFHGWQDCPLQQWIHNKCLVDSSSFKSHR